MTDKIAADNCHGILILTPDLSLDGGVTNYFNTLNLESTINVDYFYVNSATPETALGTLFRLVRNYFSFFLCLSRKRYALIHINPTLDPRSFFRDLVFIVIARIFRRPCLVFFHGWLESFEARIHNSATLRFLFRISYAKAHGFVVLSRLFQEKLAAMGAPAATQCFVETMVADSGYLHQLDLQEKIDSFNEEIKLLFLGRIVKEKGIFIAIDAFALFCKKHAAISARLIVAGDGVDLDKARQYVEQRRIPKVDFLGHIEGTQKGKLLADAHVMILPSYSEGLPCSILEGMLYGMAVIARATGAIPDVVAHGENGYLSESLDAEVYAELIAHLASDAALYETIARRNNEYALDRFVTEVVRRRLIGIYETLIGSAVVSAANL